MLRIPQRALAVVLSARCKNSDIRKMPHCLAFFSVAVLSPARIKI